MRVLVTVLAAASVARAQDKPRVGQDGRPLLNKPKVGGEIFANHPTSIIVSLIVS